MFDNLKKTIIERAEHYSKRILKKDFNDPLANSIGWTSTSGTATNICTRRLVICSSNTAKFRPTHSNKGSCGSVWSSNYM